MLPNAPIRPITINGGVSMRGWYDILTLDRTADLSTNLEDARGIEDSTSPLHSLLDHEISLLPSSHHLLLGGFSQGGAMALHAGLSYVQPLAGLASCSGYLLRSDTYPGHIQAGQRATPVLAYHGSEDDMVSAARGPRPLTPWDSFSIPCPRPTCPSYSPRCPLCFLVVAAIAFFK